MATHNLSNRNRFPLIQNGDTVQLPNISLVRKEFFALVSMDAGATTATISPAAGEMINGSTENLDVTAKSQITISIGSSKNNWSVSVVDVTEPSEGSGLPEGGDDGDVLTKTADGEEWAAPAGGGSAYVFEEVTGATHTITETHGVFLLNTTEVEITLPKITGDTPYDLIFVNNGQWVPSVVTFQGGDDGDWWDSILTNTANGNNNDDNWTTTVNDADTLRFTGIQDADFGGPHWIVESNIPLNILNGTVVTYSVADDGNEISQTASTIKFESSASDYGMTLARQDQGHIKILSKEGGTGTITITADGGIDGSVTYLLTGRKTVILTYSTSLDKWVTVRDGALPDPSVGTNGHVLTVSSGAYTLAAPSAGSPLTTNVITVSSTLAFNTYNFVVKDDNVTVTLPTITSSDVGKEIWIHQKLYEGDTLTITDGAGNYFDDVNWVGTWDKGYYDAVVCLVAGNIYGDGFEQWSRKVFIPKRIEGNATLVSGTVTVTIGSGFIGAGATVHLTRKSGTTANFGHLTYSVDSVSNQFTITSTNVLDDSVVTYLVLPDNDPS